MKDTSSVATSSFYPAGDQRDPPLSEQRGNRHEGGQVHSHKNLDSQDGRTIANRLKSQAKKPDPSHHHNYVSDEEAELSKKDPTKPAQLHGNQPSKGAKIDAELQADDEQRLREKGIKS